MNIGIIGLGDMGRVYAKAFAKAGYAVFGCDMPENRGQLEEELSPLGMRILADGHQVSSKADLLIYSVEAELIDHVVAQYGASAKAGCIVAGQTSVKYPEIQAFEKYLPANVFIVTMHAFHGPGFEPDQQKLVLIPYRSNNEVLQRVSDIFLKIGSDIAVISDYHQHDQIVADTQAVTHVGFESMGTAWSAAGFFPWENDSYLGGIDNVKILTTLRIFSYKPHVYGGLAILNPYARLHVKQYAASESDLFKMMIKQEEKEFRQRIYKARDFVFQESRKPLLLDDSIMREFSLGNDNRTRKHNSHLSLLSMVDAWHQLSTNPYDNLICQTPPFKLRLGIAEFLFRNEELLEESIEAALYDKTIRGDDLEFHSAVREWSSIITYGDLNGYKKHFDQVSIFFADKLVQGRTHSTELIKRLSR